MELEASELGPHVQLPSELRARQYVCPECVASLWVEVEPAGGDRWHDFVVTTAKGGHAV